MSSDKNVYHYLGIVVVSGVIMMSGVVLGNDLGSDVGISLGNRLN